MPTAITMTGGKLYLATAKGHGTGPNNFAQRQVEGSTDARLKRTFSFIATLLYGSLAAIDVDGVDLKAATAEVMESNRMKAAAETIQFAASAKTKADSS